MQVKKRMGSFPRDLIDAVTLDGLRLNRISTNGRPCPVRQLHPCKCAMSRIDITLATPTHPEFNCLDSFESLEEEEIEGIILILRGALAAFSAELSDRRKPWTDRTLENYKQKLQKTAKQINKEGLTQNARGPTRESEVIFGASRICPSRSQGKPTKQGWEAIFLAHLKRHRLALCSFDLLRPRQTQSGAP